MELPQSIELEDVMCHVGNKKKSKMKRNFQFFFLRNNLFNNTQMKIQLLLIKNDETIFLWRKYKFSLYGLIHVHVQGRCN